jgi:hypothetical protein
VELVLPETGVCSLDNDAAGGGGCCGTEAAVPVTVARRPSAAPTAGRCCS